MHLVDIAYAEAGDGQKDRKGRESGALLHGSRGDRQPNELLQDENDEEGSGANPS